MKAIIDRLDWLEHYIINSEPTADGIVKASKVEKEIAWTTAQEIRAIAEALNAPGIRQGCVCPPTSEKTCQAPMCPRRGLLGDGAAVRPERIIDLSGA